MSGFLDVLWNEFARGAAQTLVAALPVIVVWIWKKLKKPTNFLPWLAGGLIISIGILALWTYKAMPGVTLFGFAYKTEVFYETLVPGGWKPKYDKDTHSTQVWYHNPEKNQDMIILWEEQGEQEDTKKLILKTLKKDISPWMVENTDVQEKRRLNEEASEIVLKIPNPPMERKKTVRCNTQDRPDGHVFLIALWPSGSKGKPESKNAFDKIVKNFKLLEH
ncbi:hypothetical protein ES703_33121 [subsurface metagenome]